MTKQEILDILDWKIHTKLESKGTRLGLLTRLEIERMKVEILIKLLVKETS